MDKKNIDKLQKLRKHKINKIVIEIRKAKKQLESVLKKKDDLRIKVNEYHHNRKISHSKLFDSLQKSNAINIITLQNYRNDNQQLIDGEKDILNRIKKTEESIQNKEKEVKNFKNRLLALNKKIESLKEIKKQF